MFVHVFGDRATAAQTAAGWEVYFDRLGPHLAGEFLSEAAAHADWDAWEQSHDRYAEAFGVDPAPGRAFAAAQRGEQ